MADAYRAIATVSRYVMLIDAADYVEDGYRLGRWAGHQRASSMSGELIIRIDPAVHAALDRWAADELRSVNAQIEFLSRRALRDAGRLGPHPGDPKSDPS